MSFLIAVGIVIVLLAAAVWAFIFKNPPR